jgi:hypothetical protein
MKFLETDFDACQLAGNKRRGPDMRCFWSGSSSQNTQTTSQPVLNVTGAGSPSTQGNKSPVNTGSQSATGNTGNTNTGTQAQTKTGNAAAVNTGTITGAVSNLTVNSTDQGAVQSALAALSNALNTSQQAVGTVVGQVTAQPVAPVTSGNANTPGLTPAPASGVVTWATLAAIATIAGALLIFLRKKS